MILLLDSVRLLPHLEKCSAFVLLLTSLGILFFLLWAQGGIQSNALIAFFLGVK